MKNKIMILIFGMLLISFASAYDMGTFPKGECVEITQTCASCTYVNLSINYPNTTLAVTNDGMASIGAGGWRYSFCDTNTTGDDPYVIYGEGDLLGTATGFSELTFKITENGSDLNDMNKGSNPLLFILCLFFILGIIGIYVTENYIGKFCFYWVTHLLFILITFVGWQMGVEGAFAGLGITGIFRVLFYVSTIVVFPMVILSMAWVFYIHAFNEHFEKLISKGMDTESAFAMAEKKSGGWFNGR